VLLEPQHGGNLGFIARLLANYGLRDWWSVGGVPWRKTDAERTGAMALGELAALHETKDLEAALAGRTHLVGFTARSGYRRDPIPLEQIAAAASAWGPEAQPALLFGPEDRGLESEICERCSLLVRIPTPGLGSFNLSHAVALALYEWFRGRVALPPVEVGPAREGAGRFSGEEDKERIAQKTWDALQQARFPQPEHEIRNTLRRVLAQPIERRDLRMLERILRHVEWLEEQKSGATSAPPPSTLDA
jgi:TrmH family RNA methyltransferase